MPRLTPPTATGTFDVIVVGAGSAGCVVAARLAEAGARVAVLEAGPGLPLPDALTTLDGVAALAEDDRFWPALSARVGERRVPYRQGRGVGGSAAVNTLVAMAGDRADYDGWAADRDCEGWDWNSMAPWFARATQRSALARVAPGPVAGAFTEAAVDAGHEHGGASCDVDRLGVLAAELTARRGRRWSSAEILAGAEASTPVTVVPGASVRRVLVERGRAVGVELSRGGRMAADRVVLSAGALQSPTILAASALPGAPALGGTAEDHPSFVFTLALRPEARRPVTPGPAGRSVAPISRVLRWSSEPGARQGGDLLALMMDHVGTDAEGRRHGAVIVALTDVVSRGQLVRPSPSLALTVPLTEFEPGWLSHADDRRRFRSGVRHVGRLLASPLMSSVAEAVYLDDGGTPLSALLPMGDDELDHWLLTHPGPVSHVGATCPLGRGLELDGSVRGCERLYVIDASALPHLPNANLHLPVMALAERLAAGLV